MGKKQEDIGKNRQKPRGEIFLAGAVLLTALVCSLFWQLSHREPAVWAVVEVDGREIARYPLAKDCRVVIEGYDGGRNTLVVENGAAYVTDSNCPDHLCEKQGIVTDNGQTIICLPNRVAVAIRGGGEPALDGLAE